MDMFFRTKKSLIKMKDKVEVEGKGKNYLTTSSLSGQEKCVLGEYSTEAKAMEILDRIDRILDEAILRNKSTVSVKIPSDYDG